MRIGLFAINFSTCADPEAAVAVAQAAEAAGFESVWTGEHIVLPDPMVERSPMPASTPILDTIVALTLIASHTPRCGSAAAGYGFATDLALAAECIAAIRQTADGYERPPELGPLEITVTPVGDLEPETVQQYGALGVDRLVLLPQPDARLDQRHAPVPLETILANVEHVGTTIVNR